MIFRKRTSFSTWIEAHRAPQSSLETLTNPPALLLPFATTLQPHRPNFSAGTSMRLHFHLRQVRIERIFKEVTCCSTKTRHYSLIPTDLYKKTPTSSLQALRHGYKRWLRLSESRARGSTGESGLRQSSTTPREKQKSGRRPMSFSSAFPHLSNYTTQCQQRHGFWPHTASKREAGWRLLAKSPHLSVLVLFVESKLLVSSNTVTSRL
jgi:hypothetical protein